MRPVGSKKCESKERAIWSQDLSTLWDIFPSCLWEMWIQPLVRSYKSKRQSRGSDLDRLIWIWGFCKTLSFLWVPTIEALKYSNPNSVMFDLRSRPWLKRKAYLYPSFPICQWSHLPGGQPFSPACWTSAVWMSGLPRNWWRRHRASWHQKASSCNFCKAH